LGDVCRTVPALVTLRRAHPQARIDWLVNEPFVEAIHSHPDLTETIPFPRARFGKAWRSPKIALEAIAWLRSLRQRRYDAIFDLQGLARSGFITRFTGARLRVGFADAREGAFLAYNRPVAVDPGLHTVDRMLGLLEGAGYSPVHDLRLHVSEVDLAWRHEHFHQSGLDPDAPYVCIAPTAQWLCKCWPIENFREITRRILDAAPAKSRSVVVLATPSERPLVAPLLDGFQDERRVIAPTTGIGQMMALIRDSALLVGNDSAPLHIAVGFDRPIVAVFGPTDPALVGPYRRDNAVLRAPVRPDDAKPYRRHRDDQSLIARVGTEEVWELVERTLAVRFGDSTAASHIPR
jgi:lipopolysaccharide heptosyltransferase I